MKKNQNKQPLADIAIIGLGTMGSALAQNMARNNIRVSVYNRTKKKTEQFVQEHPSEYIVPQSSLKKCITSLASPATVLLMIPAGDPVDHMIKRLAPLLKKGDSIIDGGNSHYQHTQQRYDLLEKKGIHYLGCGISGGEEGALFGPSLMPGGSKTAWEQSKDMLQTIAAKDFNGNPCVNFIGPDGAGHYVKMVHNAIEYAIMELIAETYAILRKQYKLRAPEIAKIFAHWNTGKLNSFLFDIVPPILEKEDEQTGECCLIYHILDAASEKGTGKWAAIDALDKGVALPSSTEAVFSRYISSHKTLRTNLHNIYPHNYKRQRFHSKHANKIEDALYAAIISAFAQGYDLIAQASEQYRWNISLAEISRIWQGGCIIRAGLLELIEQSYKAQPQAPHMFALDAMQFELKQHIPALRRLVAQSTLAGIPLPAYSSTLYYFEAMREKQLPANLIQAMRDYFGAHTYQRSDSSKTFHTQWK